MAPIATVFGATGLQGGSVVRALLDSGTFTPRAVTRSASSDAAKTLQAQGVEVVEADLDDPAAVLRAVDGAEVVFAVTFPNFKTLGTGGEFRQGKNMVDAAKAAGVKYLVWSSIASVKALSQGKYESAPLDEKADVDDYLRSSGVPHSILLTGGFLENYTRENFRDCFSLNAAGEVTTKARWVPGTLATFSWIGRDLGLSVSGLFNAYAAGRLREINGKDYVMGCAQIPIEEYFKRVEKALGRKVNVTWLSSVGLPMLDLMYDSAGEFTWYANREVPDPGLRSLGIEFGTIEDFVHAEVKPLLGM